MIHTLAHFKYMSDFISKPCKIILFRLHYLLMFLLLIPYEQSFCQEPSRIIPDGTQGEVFVVGDSAATGAKFKNWNEFDGPLTTLKIGGGFLTDFSAYKQDPVSKEQLEMKSSIKVRDVRITMSGRFKIKRDVTWKAGIMYDGTANGWFVRETGVMVAIPKLSGHIFIGRTKEGFSLNKVMVGYAGWTQERQMALDVIPILADGVKWLGYLPKQHILWNFGIYANWFSEDHSFSTYRWQSALRIGWLPVYSKPDKTVLHLAANLRYGEPEDGKIRVRSKPEDNNAPYFVDTDVFTANHSTHIGWEAYYRSGPLMLGTEYYAYRFSSPETNNPVFYGGDVVATYLITGETRPYSNTTGIFGFVPVKKSVFDGGPGAWEAVLRLSNIDLDSGTLTGGKFWRITPMVNWYLSKNVRLALTYGYGVLHRFNKSGTTQFFQSRIQFML